MVAGVGGSLSHSASPSLRGTFFYLTCAATFFNIDSLLATTHKASIFSSCYFPHLKEARMPENTPNMRKVQLYIYLENISTSSGKKIAIAHNEQRCEISC